MMNGKKTAQLRIPSDLHDVIHAYHVWRIQTHPRLKLQDAARELLYIGSVAARALQENFVSQAAVEQEKSRHENRDFVTKFLGERAAVASQY